MEETPHYRRGPEKPAAPSAFRQDLLRGIRWGTILLLVMLLGVTAYRVLSSNPAAASQAKAVEELAPAPEVAPAAAIQVGDAVLKGPDAPAAPEPQKARRSAAKPAPVAAEPPQRLQAPKFAPLPVAAVPKAQSNGFVAAPLPEPTPAPQPNVDIPASAAVPVPAPAVEAAAADNSKQGNRAVRAVRSVGRFFRLGRKDDAAKEEPAKK